MGLALTAAGEPAEGFALQIGESLAVVLGCIMAHEVGHLIGLRHSPAGIMKPQFEKRDIERANMGLLHFTEQDGSVLRAFIAKGFTFAEAGAHKDIAAIGGRPPAFIGR